MKLIILFSIFLPIVLGKEKDLISKIDGEHTSTPVYTTTLNDEEIKNTSDILNVSDSKEIVLDNTSDEAIIEISKNDTKVLINKKKNNESNVEKEITIEINDENKLIEVENIDKEGPKVNVEDNTKKSINTTILEVDNKNLEIDEDEDESNSKEVFDAITNNTKEEENIKKIEIMKELERDFKEQLNKFRIKNVTLNTCNETTPTSPSIIDILNNNTLLSNLFKQLNINHGNKTNNFLSSLLENDISNNKNNSVDDLNDKDIESFNLTEILNKNISILNQFSKEKLFFNYFKNCYSGADYNCLIISITSMLIGIFISLIILFLICLILYCKKKNSYNNFQRHNSHIYKKTTKTCSDI